MKEHKLHVRIDCVWVAFDCEMVHFVTSGASVRRISRRVLPCNKRIASIHPQAPDPRQLFLLHRPIPIRHIMVSY